jgi:UDP-N-acetylglucosamine transferase subunit ALG13
MTTLLVANDGGHIMQLHTLRPRLGIGDDVVWVTPRTPQTESLLEGERVHWAEPCPPRDMHAVLRNAARCRLLFDQYRVTLVVSTGAALALAVLPQARLHHIETVYIESATRMTEPSVSGRVLSWIPGIRTYSQSESLSRHRWHYLASPWDLYQSAEADPRPVRRVVVSLGTQQDFGFRRLVERLVAILPRDVEVLWQTGSTDVTGLGIDPRPKVPAAEMNQALAMADAVVAHAGTGIALAALEAGRLPVLVPRQSRQGEHVDDHQLNIALELCLRDLCITRNASSLKFGDLALAASRVVTKVPATEATLTLPVVDTALAR